jgi:hypothetical protein
MTLCGGAFAGERLLHQLRPFRIWLAQPFKQAVGTDLEELFDAGKSWRKTGITPTFNSAHGLPMHANKFSETLLGHAGLQARLANVLPDAAHHLTVCHALMPPQTQYY